MFCIKMDLFTKDFKYFIEDEISSTFSSSDIPNAFFTWKSWLFPTRHTTRVPAETT